jgi:hypothetical protein
MVTLVTSVTCCQAAQEVTIVSTARGARTRVQRLITVLWLKNRMPRSWPARLL